MVSNIVRIIYMGNDVKIKFEYDVVLVKMMRSFQAIYHSPGKSWSLPLERVEDLVEELVFKGYKVTKVGDEEYKVLREKE